MVGSLVKECETLNMTDTKLPLVSPPALSPVLGGSESIQKTDSLVTSILDLGEVAVNLTDSVTSLRASEVGFSAVEASTDWAGFSCLDYFTVALIADDVKWS